MATTYCKINLYLDALNQRARDMAMMKVNAETTPIIEIRSRWEQKLEECDGFVREILSMAIVDGFAPQIMLEHFNQMVDHFEGEIRRNMGYRVQP